MDFLRVMDRVAEFVGERGARYGIIGGVGIAAYGLMRTTLDLDFVVDRGIQKDLVSWMESLGYETLHRSRGFSNHLHEDPEMGRVDFVYVSGDTAETLFGELRWLEGPADRKIPVPRPEHLAAMKASAMKSDPGRAFQEMADVRFLLQLPDVDRDAVREQFERRGLLEQFLEIEESL